MAIFPWAYLFRSGSTAGHHAPRHDGCLQAPTEAAAVSGHRHSHCRREKVLAIRLPLLLRPDATGPRISRACARPRGTWPPCAPPAPTQHQHSTMFTSIGCRGACRCEQATADSSRCTNGLIKAALALCVHRSLPSEQGTSDVTLEELLHQLRRFALRHLHCEQIHCFRSKLINRRG